MMRGCKNISKKLSLTGGKLEGFVNWRSLIAGTEFFPGGGKVLRIS